MLASLTKLVGSKLVPPAREVRVMVASRTLAAMTFCNVHRVLIRGSWEIPQANVGINRHETVAANSTQP